MTSIRKLGYAALLAVAIFNYAPTLASAEEPAKGRFTFTHSVRWENASVPAGDYEFSYDPDSISPMLTITKVTGPRASFMLLVPMREESTSKGSSLLLLETSAAGSYVSAMQLPDSGMTLHFHTPRVAEKQLAKAEAPAATLGQ
jgi:hypothetical protein